MPLNNEVIDGALADAKALIAGLESRYLKQLVQHLQSEIKGREKSDIAEAKLKIHAIAQSVGMPAEQLMRNYTGKPHAMIPASRRAPSQVLYIDPNTTRTWTGRGIKPTWLKMLIDQGHTLESLAKPVAKAA